MEHNKPWRGIMKILELQHWRNGEIISEQKNLRNLLHYDGEEFILRAAFTGGRVSEVIPDNYYLGLDNRETLLEADNMDGLIGEPIGSGYARQTVTSAEGAQGFVVTKPDGGHFRAVSTIVAFTASGGSWGPVNNLFLTNRNDAGGYLISSVRLEAPLSLDDGDKVTMRLSMTLKDCN